jgi:predicted amidohydrolase YtcJ
VKARCTRQLSLLVSLLAMVTIITSCKGTISPASTPPASTSQSSVEVPDKTIAGSSEPATSVPESTPTQNQESPTSPESADLVLLNGKIITVDERDSIMQAVAVKDGKLIKVGTNESIIGFIGERTNVIDLKGKTVTPGLIDAHLHSFMWAKYDERNINLYDVRSKSDVLKLIADRVKVIPKGEWIAAINCRFINKEDWPTKAELDAVSPDNPVFIWHATGGPALANSYALRLAQITRLTSAPYGGIIEKDAAGEPNGLLMYSAAYLVSCLVPSMGTRTLEEQKADIIRGTTQMIGEGYTSGRELSTEVEALQELAKEGKLPMRLTVYQSIDSVDDANQFINNIKKVKTYETDMFQVVGVGELKVDGTTGANQALMYDTQLKIAQEAYPFISQEDLNQIVSIIHKGGYQLDIHTWGDKAIDMALDAIDLALKEAPRPNHRHTLEHATYLTMTQLERIKKLGIVVSVQPAMLFLFQRSHLLDLGNESLAAQRQWLIKTMLNMGIPVAFGTDNPEVGTYYSPKYGFIAAVTRQMIVGPGQYQVFAPEEAISIQQALRCYTMGSAYAAFQENVRGSIAEGKFADMVIWSHDLYSSLSLEDWRNFKTEVTIVNGKVVYKSDSCSLSIVQGSEFTLSK